MLNRNYIHDIKPTSRTQKRRDAFHRAHEKRLRQIEEQFGYDERPTRAYSNSGGGKGMWYVAVLAVLVLVFALTYIFAGATVYVTPRTGTVEVSGPILAQKESKDGLTFEMLVLKDEKSIKIPAGEKEYVEKKAVGTVRIFNNNQTAQKLLIDTRLETENGYIYKTKVATTVPALSESGGKKNPGYVDVEVYADEPGDVYNVEQADFKIVGFRGSPKYETIYAKSLTPIKGGFKGETYDISDEDFDKNKNDLRNELTASLLEKAKAELPEDFVMYKDVSMIKFDDPVVSSSEEDSSMVEFKQVGEITAIVFNQEELTKTLVQKVVSDTEENSVEIENLKDLNIRLDQGSFISDPKTMDDIKLVIEDKIKVVWNINENEIKDVLMGIKKRDFQNTMLRFKNIENANLKLKPLWKNKLPEKPNSIKVVDLLRQEQSN